VTTKTATELERVAELFHALADPTRLGIIEQLRGGEQCVCDLTDMLETGQSRLSFHLKTLKEAGLLRDRRQGRWIYYSLEPGAIAEIESAVAAIKPRSTGDRRRGVVTPPFLPTRIKRLI